MGGFMGFYRFYGRGYRNFIKYKIFYKYFLSERMQRSTVKKKVKGHKKIKVMRGGGIGCLFCIPLWICFLLKSLTGGGEVSGGGIHYM
jgi:hypothetical protein